MSWGSWRGARRGGVGRCVRSSPGSLEQQVEEDVEGVETVHHVDEAAAQAADDDLEQEKQQSQAQQAQVANLAPQSHMSIHDTHWMKQKRTKD